MPSMTVGIAGTMNLDDMTSTKSNVGALTGDFTWQVRWMEHALDIERGIFNRREEFGCLFVRISDYNNCLSWDKITTGNPLTRIF